MSLYWKMSLHVDSTTLLIFMKILPSVWWVLIFLANFWKNSEVQCNPKFPTNMHFFPPQSLHHQIVRTLSSDLQDSAHQMWLKGVLYSNVQNFEITPELPAASFPSPYWWVAPPTHPEPSGGPWTAWPKRHGVFADFISPVTLFLGASPVE